ncbi:hypothetical protein Ga0080574_TMP1260 [Salipiger abyssi]|uniref:Uncharacterized protein n=1 Tax=Salipiger abyssi TaxID=1250539 RepID=A0A1P8UQB4_9RHOB|nr:hypothetical protein Ga0080574_TMP1260 [Salipiger abyssi]
MQRFRRCAPGTREGHPAGQYGNRVGNQRTAPLAQRAFLPPAHRTENISFPTGKSLKTLPASSPSLSA